MLSLDLSSRARRQGLPKWLGQLGRNLTLAAALMFASLQPSGAGESVQIDELVVAGSISDAQRNSTVSAARTFYEFWNTGEVILLNRAVADSFTDHTLPPGRPQGPAGPAFASRQFRAAVPDLGVRVAKMILADDFVTVHMTFSGHFTGRFGRTQGRGQPIAFIATDLLKVENGRITANWHIEDNLTLFQAMGIASVNP